MPPCVDYFKKEENVECTPVFDDHFCNQGSLGACRPTGYNALGGVADQCAEWMAQ